MPLFCGLAVTRASAQVLACSRKVGSAPGEGTNPFVARRCGLASWLRLWGSTGFQIGGWGCSWSDARATDCLVCLQVLFRWGCALWKGRGGLQVHQTLYSSPLFRAVSGVGVGGWGGLAQKMLASTPRRCLWPT